MAGRPPAGASFEVGAVGGRRHASRAVILCVTGMAVLVGIAAVGRVLEAPTASGTGLAASTPAATSATRPIATLEPAADDAAAIDLRSPAIGPITLTTATLTVFGSVNVRSDHVEVALQGRNERTTAQAFVDVASAWDVFRPDASPTFRAQFDLRSPRRLGTMWIEITVFDADGRTLASERRAFIVGPIRSA